MTKNKLIQLEALRGMAALYVVFHHTIPYELDIAGFNVGILVRFGQEAVILFFLISGFVIQYSFENSTDKRFSTYFKKRFYRIYIPLLIVLGIGYLSTSFNKRTWIDPQLCQLLGNLLMVQEYSDARPNVYLETYLGNDPLWSLTYEWWFYMMFFPFTKYIANTVDRDNTVFLISISAAVLHFYWPFLPLRILMYFGIWWSGAYLAQRYILDGLNNFNHFLKPLLVTLVICSINAVNVLDKLPVVEIITPGFYPLLELRHFIFVALALISAYLWKKFNWFGFNYVVLPFASLAPISYTVYIIHFYVFTRGTYLDFIVNPIVEWIAYFSVVLILSYLIERIVYPATTSILRRQFP